MGIQPSASKIGLLLQCPRPFEADLFIEPREAEEPARYGTAFHKGMELTWKGKKFDAADLVEKYRLTVDPKHLAHHVKTSHTYLKKWLADHEYMPVGFEESLAYSLTHDNVREIVLTEETHTYVGLEDDEICGTYDLTADGPADTIVIDYKTGSYVTPDPKTPQMLTLAALTGCKKVAIFHTPLLSIPTIYVAEVTEEEVADHLLKIQHAFRLAKEGGFMRTGPECRYCPAKSDCPTQVGTVLVETTALVKKVHGAIAPLLPDQVDRPKFLKLARDLEKLVKAARAQILEEVRAGAIYETDDGAVYDVVEASRENISKKSITEALGKTKGEAMIEELRKLGCITTSTWEELRAK